MTNKKIKKCFVCLKLVKKNQKILSCSTCLQTIYLNCIKDKYCITKNMQWKYTFCSFTFPFSSCSDKEFAELFDFGNSNLFYSAKNLNDLFKNISTYNKHSIANQDSCNGNEINFFQNVDDQYLSSKDANSILFNTSNENSNFSVLCLNIRSLSNLKIFSKLEGLLSSLTLAPSLIAITETWLKPNYSESIVNLPGYSFISNPRIQTQGGGVGF